MPFRFAVVEGALEVQIAQRLARHFDFEFRSITDKHGGDRFWKEAARFDRAARNVGPVLGLVDLEGAVCPSHLIQSRLGWSPHPNFALRVAVRMSESWLLADSNGIARYLHVPVNKVPADPEAEVNPKQRVVNLARQSRSRAMRDKLVPTAEMRGVTVGREYLPTMSEFIRDHWDVGSAAAKAPSLRRALDAIAARL